MTGERELLSQHSRSRSHNRIVAVAAIFVFVLAISLPFVGQPFHIDDAIFLDFAEINLENPLQQHIDDYRLMGREVASFRDTHPPLNQLYLASLMGLAGGSSEIFLHVGFIVFPLMAGISMYFLGIRFTDRPLAAALLFLATPAVMTMSHTLMADLPMASLWLAATASYVSGVDRNSARLLALAAIFSFLAVMAGYQALALIVLLPLYAALRGRLSVRYALPMLAPALGFLAYVLASYGVYGAGPRFTHAGGLSLAGSSVWERLQGILLQTGGASVFPLAMAAIFTMRRWRAALVLAAIATLLAALFYQREAAPLSSGLLFLVFIFASGVMIFAIGGDALSTSLGLLRRRKARASTEPGASGLAGASGPPDPARQVDSSGQAATPAKETDGLFLSIWLLVMMLGVTVLLPHATAKYSLPFLAPLVLLLLREMAAAATGARLRNVSLAAVAALTLGAATLVSAADYRLAVSSRSFAQELAQRHEIDGDVWFVGEWGFRHYMERQGYRYLSSTDGSPKDGDLVIRSEFSFWPLASSVQDRMRLVETSSEQWSLPLRVMNFDAEAGFYGSHWGDLPYAFSDEAVQRFEVYRLVPVGEPEPNETTI